jgi:hypothetical protein
MEGSRRTYGVAMKRLPSPTTTPPSSRPSSARWRPVKMSHARANSMTGMRQRSTPKQSMVRGEGPTPSDDWVDVRTGRGKGNARLSTTSYRGDGCVEDAAEGGG